MSRILVVGGLDRILSHCLEQQKAQGTPDALVTFSLRGRWGTRQHARLFGKAGGPKGNILGDDPRRPGCIVVGFVAAEVIAFLEKAGRTITFLDGERVSP